MPIRFLRWAALAGCFVPMLFADSSCWLRGAASPAPSTVHALCEQGTLWTTTDGGAAWSARDMHATEPLCALAFIDAARGLAVRHGGLVLATEDGGKSWNPRPSGTQEKLLDVAVAGEQAWACGMNGTLIHTAAGGRTWAQQKTGTTQAMESNFFLDPRHGWAGMILRTADGGNTWQQIKTDAAQWSLAAVFFRDVSNGWAVGFVGQILRSTDAGSTWKVLKSPTSGWLTSIAFDRQNRAWISYDDGFLISEDGGSTWKAITTADHYFLSRLLRVDGTLWAIGQSSILKRTENGLDWRKIDTLIPDSSMREPPITEAPAAK